MISTLKTAQILTDKLNAIAENSDKKIKFFIHTNSGDYAAAINNGRKELPTLLINGMLIENMSTPIPLQGLNSYVKQETLNFIVPINPKATTAINDETVTRNASIEYAMNIITAFVQDIVGLSGTVTDDNGDTYSYVIGISTPSVGNEGYFGGVGKAIPASLSVAWQFIEGGVISNDIKFTLNGTPVVMLDGAIVRTRIGDTNNVKGAEEMTTVITQQGLAVKLTLPYKRNDVSETLVDDMLNGTLSTKYELSYNDGVLSKSWTMVATEITAGLNPGKGITLTATFEIARA